MPSLDVRRPRVHQVGLPYHWGTRGLVTGDVVNDLVAMSEEPNVRIMETKGLVCHISSRDGGRRGARRSTISSRLIEVSILPITGFLTDSTLCIGCKACEVACKEWNDVPADGFAWTGHSYDNTLHPRPLDVAARQVRRAWTPQTGVRRQRAASR